MAYQHTLLFTRSTTGSKLNNRQRWCIYTPCWPSSQTWNNRLQTGTTCLDGVSTHPVGHQVKPETTNSKLKQQVSMAYQHTLLVIRSSLKQQAAVTYQHTLLAIRSNLKQQALNWSNRQQKYITKLLLVTRWNVKKTTGHVSLHALRSWPGSRSQI